MRGSGFVWLVFAAPWSEDWGAHAQPRRVLSGLRGGAADEGDDLGVFSATATSGEAGVDADVDGVPTGECPMGQYMWSTGKVWPESSRACLPCPIDTFWDGTQKPAVGAKFGRCVSCPAGKHQPVTGMLGCDAGAAGSSGEGGSGGGGGGDRAEEEGWVAAEGCSDCCAAGLFRMYLNSAFAYCKPCPVGTFWPRPSTPDQAVYVCRACPGGQHQPLTGKAYCLAQGETQAQYEAASKQLLVVATAFLRNVTPTEMTAAWLQELTDAVASVTGGRKADVVATEIKPFGVWSARHPGATHGMRLELEQRCDSDVMAQNVLAILGMADFTKILKKHMMDDGEWLPEDVSLVIKHPRVTDANHRDPAEAVAAAAAAKEVAAARHGGKEAVAAKAAAFLRAASHMVEGSSEARERQVAADDDVTAAMANIERKRKAAATGGGAAATATKAVGFGAVALFALAMCIDRNNHRKVNNPFKPMEIHGKL